MRIIRSNNSGLLSVLCPTGTAVRKVILNIRFQSVYPASASAVLYVCRLAVVPPHGQNQRNVACGGWGGGIKE